MDTLKRIYYQKPRTSGWYKKGQRDGAQCPDDPTLSVRQSYLKQFGCLPSEQPIKHSEKSKAAKTCASERMANMKYSHVSKGRPADKGHIHPIKIAYGLGKQCLQIQGAAPSESEEHYKRIFRTWYDELIKGSNPTHALFQQNIGTTERYPLEAYDPSTNNKTPSASSVKPPSVVPQTPDKSKTQVIPTKVIPNNTKSNNKSKSPQTNPTRRRKRPLFVSNNMY